MDTGAFLTDEAHSLLADPNDPSRPLPPPLPAALSNLPTLNFPLLSTQTQV
jgi:hypothetical protein